MKNAEVTLFLFLFACGGESATNFTDGGSDTPAEAGMTYRLTFDSDAPGALSAELHNVLGDWKVEADAAAPSQPNVLRQKGDFAGPDFPRVVMLDRTFTNPTVRVRCKMESGSTDRACGLMFRLEDSDNYYITRANALEGNVRLYKVVGGARDEFASASLDVTAGEWHTLEAAAQGTRLVVRWNGRQLIDAVDDTFSRGNVGLWTKADSVTAFDDLEASEGTAP